MSKTTIVDRLDYEVVKKPLFVQIDEFNVHKCPDKVALVNDSTNEVISYMSPNYRLFNNEEFMNLTERVQQTFDLELSHYNSYKGGRKVLSAFKQTDKKHSVCGFDFENHIVLYDSRDGSMCLGIGSIGKLYRCNNMFTSMRNQDKKGSVLKINHSSKLDDMLHEFESSLEIYAAMQVQTIAQIERLQDVKVTQENLYQLIGGWTQLNPQQVRDIAYSAVTEEVSTRKKNIIDGLVNSWSIESGELGQNGFGLYNAVTHYYTHKRNKGENEILFEDFGKRELETINFVMDL